MPSGSTSSKQVVHLTAERHFKPDNRQKQQWPVSRLVTEVAEELQVFCDRTCYTGFPDIVPSTDLLTVDASSDASAFLGDMFTSAMNAPVACNSIVVNQAVNVKKY